MFTQTAKTKLAAALCAALGLTGCAGRSGANRDLQEQKVTPAAVSPRISQVAIASTIVGRMGSDSGAHLGHSVAVGDFNGDGFMDAAVGMPGANGGRGAVALVYGDEYGMDLDNRDLYTRTRLTQEFFTGYQTDREGDQFGYAVVAADFDNDGLTDLAISAPYRSVDGHAEAGRVYIAYGNRSRGPSAMTIRKDTFTQSPAGRDQQGDHFGLALAAGDFDGNGYPDLAIGVPDEDDEGFNRANSGAVFIRFSDESGLRERGYRFITASRVLNGGNQTESGERFGAALAAGQLHVNPNRPAADLIVGAPGKDYTYYSVTGGGNLTHRDLGRVYVYYYGNGQFGHVIDIIPRGSPVGATGFGSALAVGDFDGNRQMDLAIGSPQYDSSAGRVYVAMSDPTYHYVGALAEPDDRPLRRWFRRAQQELNQTPIAIDRENDQYGFSLAAADFNGDGFTDLVIGAPGKTWQRQARAGLVFVMMGGATGLMQTYGCRYFVLDQAPRGANEEGDRFGYALAAGGANPNGFPDLVIGGPYEDNDGVIDGGAVFLARTTSVTPGPFDGVWTGQITDDEGNTGTLRCSVCDVDGEVTGSASVDTTLYVHRCTDGVLGAFNPGPMGIGRTADINGTKNAGQPRSVTVDLLNMGFDPDQLRATVTAPMSVNVGATTITATIRVRSVSVNTDLGWIAPGSCASVDWPVTLTKID